MKYINFDKLIKKGKPINNPNSLKFKNMIEIKHKYNLQHNFEDDSIDNYYADSKLGGGALEMSFSGGCIHNGYLYDEPRISRVEYRINLETGFLSWIDLWKIMDDFIVEHNICITTIWNIDIYEQPSVLGFSEKLKVNPFFYN
jgi:hypothetical protein